MYYWHACWFSPLAQKRIMLKTGVDRKDITGYTEIGFYSLDGVCTFAEQEQVQAAINSKRLTYRLQNSDQSKYIHVKFTGKPATVGQKIRAGILIPGRFLSSKKRWRWK